MDEQKGEEFLRDRLRMVARQLRGRGIRDPRVLAAMARVPRHLFVPPVWQREAYADYPLPIGAGQTISQPYIVARMTEALELEGPEKVLEIGTGSGYQTAILAALAREVWTIERVPALSKDAEKRLRRLGYTNIHFFIGDGTLGLPQEAPFGRIIATGGLPRVPQTLIDQLGDSGIIVAPVGRRDFQRLVKLRKVGDTVEEVDLDGCRFVPLIGKEGW